MLKLLIADDEPFTLRMLRSLLDWESLGIEIAGEVSNGQEALDFIQTEKPDIVMTDIRMPLMTGLELVKKANHFSQKIKFIIMSAYSDVEYLKEAMKLGCCDYIIKPIDEYELEDTFHRVVSRIYGEKEEARLNYRNSRQLELLSFYHYMTTGKGVHKNSDFTDLWEKEMPYSVFMLQINNGSINEYVTASQVELAKTGYFSNVIKTVLSEITSRFLLFDYEEGVWTVVADIDFTAAKVSASEKIVRYLEDEMGVSVSACFSQTGYGPEELPKLYEEAAALLRYSFYAGEDKILGYGYNCSQKEFEEVCAIGKQKDLAQSVKNNDTEKKQIIYSKPVKQSLEILEQNYSENLSLDDICARISVSKNYFCYLFKREVGVSIWNYLTDIRIRHARELLETTDLKSYEIALRVGYDSPGYFSKLFKKSEALSPNEYREQFRKKGEWQ